MHRNALLLVIACALSACAPAQPATREGQCARLETSGEPLPMYAFCSLGVSRCVQPPYRLECLEVFRGEQAICATQGDRESPSPLPCERCPAGWECRPYDNPSSGGSGDPLRWCFPGPRCGTDRDASATDASAG